MHFTYVMAYATYISRHLNTFTESLKLIDMIFPHVVILLHSKHRHLQVDNKKIQILLKNNVFSL